MMMRFSSLSFLPMWKIGETMGEGPFISPFRATCSTTHLSSTSDSFLERGYGLHLIDVGASGRNSMAISGFLAGGKRLDSSSEKTFQCRLNSGGIVSMLRWVFRLSSTRLHSWARLVHLRKATSFSGIFPVRARVLPARPRALLRYLYLALCRATGPFSSLPLAQSTGGLNSLRKGYPKIILSPPSDVRKNCWSFSWPPCLTRSQQ